MPMIDAYATVGTFADKHQLARDLAAAVMQIEQVPDIPMFRQNTAAFVHELPAGALSNVDGDGNYVRVQVLTNAGALDRDKQLAVVSRLTEIVAAAAGDPTLANRTWVLHRGARGRLGPLGPRAHQRRARRRRPRPARRAGPGDFCSLIARSLAAPRRSRTSAPIARRGERTRPADPAEPLPLTESTNYR